MGIEEKALKFAINAHRGQVRKSDKDKPMIFHPINVANILKKYGFDSNVVAAGYLHDVVEDTKYTFDEIKDEFGDDICSLVLGASEEDKSLSWEERKQITIDKIKNLDIRHKAIICADKISNLEDINILCGIKGDKAFDSFNRGKNSQLWYYSEVYKSLIENMNEIPPMFDEYKQLLDKVFYYNGNEYLEKIIFNDDKKLYSNLQLLDYKKKELKKLLELSINSNPYIIEFTGTPRTGKTSLINNLEDFFKKGGFSVDVLEEFTTSKKYKKEIYPLLKDKYKSIINSEIPKYVFNQLLESINSNKDIIIIDRSLLDRLIWADRLYLKNGFTEEEYKEYKDEYIPKIKEYIDIVIGTYTDSITSLKRDYKNSLALEERHFLNIDNVNEYNTSFINIEKLSKKEGINFHKVDTTNKNQRDISIDVANIILDNAKDSYIKRLIKEYKL